MTKIDGKTFDIEDQNIKKLKELFPEADTDGKIDFEKLKQVLGEYVDDSDERYKFIWNGKGEALRISQTQSMGTLRPAPEEGESKNWDSTGNLYIEGDNLEVLKLLQKSYFGKIKMIYIDPPYNTGKDFVYKDNYKDNIKNYKKITGQVDNNGNINTTNPEYSGRYHTDWLNMMYPRLRLARNLLKYDGVIFISIDDNEVHNIRKICDEIFGEDNFIDMITWQSLDTIKNDARHLSGNTEYVMIYAKEEKHLTFRGVKKGEKQISYYKNYDNDPRGKYLLTPLHAKSGSSTYSYVFKNGQEWKPPVGTYPRFSKETLKRLEDENKIYISQKGKSTPQKKTFLSEVGLRMPATTFWNYEKFGSTRQSNSELRELLGRGIFQNPKSLKMLKTLIDIIQDAESSIILDFFSGSSTTAHAVMDLNAEDNGNRKYIMVQLPETIEKNDDAYKSGYKNIANIGKERIRRAGDKIKAELEEKYREASEDEREDMKNPEELDIGFKVFKLDTSNIKEWNPGKYDNIQLAIEDSHNPYVNGRTEEDVVYEMILKMGLDLTYPVEKHKVADKVIYSIGYGLLMICLSNNIDLSVAEKMIEIKNNYNQDEFRAIFRDGGFNSDKDKTNIKETLKSEGLAEESFITL